MNEIVGAFGLMEEAGRVLLVRERRVLDGVPCDCWDLPGGGVEPGEALIETLTREFEEETGLLTEPIGLAFMIERFGFRSSDPARRSRFFFFYLRRIGGELAPRDPEILEAGWRTWEEMRGLCVQAYHAEMWSWHDGGRRDNYWLTVRDPAGRAAARRGS
jgi:ADP-ribose pyrophosphatase YjhB (NUDIX family)